MNSDQAMEFAHQLRDYFKIQNRNSANTQCAKCLHVPALTTDLIEGFCRTCFEQVKEEKEK